MVDLQSGTGRTVPGRGDDGPQKDGPRQDGPVIEPPGPTQDPGVDGAPTSDLALIHEEIIEHQRWGRAKTNVGMPGSPERAAFISEQMGEGAIEGGLTGLGLGFAGGAVGKMAARFVPIPGVGAILGGGMSAYSMFAKGEEGWNQSFDTIGNFGEGDSTYEMLANSIASVSEVIQLVCDIMNVISGVIGIISAAMWVITVATLGAASPLAATLSAIAMGIGAASGVLDLINNLLLQPAVMLFRALHTFTAESDPREVEAQGAGLTDASSRAAGALGGWAGGKAGEAAGGAVGDAHLARTYGDGNGSSQGADAPTTPEATTRTDGPETRRSTDAPDPARRTPPPEVEAPTRTDGPEARTGTREPRRGMDAIRDEFRTRMEAENRLRQDRLESTRRRHDDAAETARERIEDSRSQTHDEIDAETRARLESPEIIADRHAFEMEVRDAAQQHRMADLDAASEAYRARTETADTRFREVKAEIDASRNRQLAEVDSRRVQEQLGLMERRDGGLPGDAFEQTRRELDVHHTRDRSAIVESTGTRLDTAIAEYEAAYSTARQESDLALERASSRYTEAIDGALSDYDTRLAQGPPGVDAPEAAAGADGAADGAADGTTASGPGQRLQDAMVRSRLDYANGIEGYRPDWWKNTLGQSKVLDMLVFPFVDDFIKPFTIRQRIAEGPAGLPANANEKLGNVAVAAGQGVYDEATDKAGQDAAAKTQGELIGSHEYTRDNPGMEERIAGDSGPVNTERVDPDYEEPPGTPEQLEIILDQIEGALAARADAEAAEQRMAAERTSHEENTTGIDETVSAGETALSAQQAHEEAVDRRASANADQQSRVQEAQGLMEGYPEQAAGLAVITGPLKAFQGFTWIASKVPGSVGESFQRMNDDANRMSEAFGQMDETMGGGATAGQGEQARLQGDAERIANVQGETGTNRAQFEEAHQGALGLRDANATRIQDAGAAEQEARSQREEIDAAVDQRRGDHGSLLSELTGWAYRHRDQRTAALTRQRENTGASKAS